MLLVSIYLASWWGNREITQKVELIREFKNNNFNNNFIIQHFCKLYYLFHFLYFSIFNFSACFSVGWYLISIYLASWVMWRRTSRRTPWCGAPWCIRPSTRKNINKSREKKLELDTTSMILQTISSHSPPPPSPANLNVCLPLPLV